MTRRSLAAVLLVLLLAGCGKYGAPVRPGVGAGAGQPGRAAPHPADCQDPEHGHEPDGSDAGAAP